MEYFIGKPIVAIYKNFFIITDNQTFWINKGQYNPLDKIYQWFPFLGCKKYIFENGHSVKNGPTYKNFAVRPLFKAASLP